MTKMVLTAPDGTDLRDSLTRKEKRDPEPGGGERLLAPN